MMEATEPSEAEYYFDVTEQQWWVLLFGSTEWERLPHETAVELGLHEAVMRQQCTFVESTLDDYKNAVTANETDEPSVQQHATRPSVTIVEPESQSPNESQNVTAYPSINSNDTLPTPSHQHATPAHDYTSQRSSDQPSSAEQDEAHLQGMLDSSSDCPTQAPQDPSNANRRSAANSAVIGKQLSSLMSETADLKRSYETKDATRVEKVESFVRTAVRHATRVDTGGISDCIRAVAAERERMRSMATIKTETAEPGERYQKMIARARTLAAMSQGHEPPRESSPESRHNSILRDLRLEMTRGEQSSDSQEVNFDASSDSGDEGEYRPLDSLQSLMSQRLSLRRESSRFHGEPSE
ncbi:uncharacterized protein BcabD6B2_11790 [Babesia caballi]|uniref:Uncharacterized protein n=1 Tax=Babesia caballi TaxID=5871 RepID=A0AAV4LPJ9_BABCB|nr:hypothetical protein, conserved [Babesia caballi]